MPKLSVWFVRASLIHMGVGFLLGTMILHHKGVPIYLWTWKLLNPHIEVMIFGWTMQFVMGVAFWILPRFPREPRYGNVLLGWWSFALLNIGVTLTSIAHWYYFDPVSLVGRIASLTSVVLFAVVMWPRVKPVGGLAASQGTTQDTFVV